jgi:adenylate cyclase
MKPFTSFPRRSFLAAAILWAALAAAAGLWERGELAAYDGWFNLRGARKPPPEIVIVEVDDASIQELGPFPWPRSTHARLLARLAEARVVGWDLLFDSHGAPGEDAAFAAALGGAGPRQVLASMFAFSRNEDGGWLQELRQPVGELARAADSTGFINMPTDADNVVRGVIPADLNFFGRPYPSFGLAVALAALGLGVDDLKLGPAGLEAGPLRVPWDGRGPVLIDFWGPGRTFTMYRYADVLAGRVAPELLRDRIVLVGPTSPVSKDEYPNPFTRGNLVLGNALPPPGVEIHASAVASFLEGRYYRRAGPAANLAVLVLAGPIAWLVARRLSPWRGLAAALGLAGALAAAVYGLWAAFGLWLNFFGPAVSAGLTYVLVNIDNYLAAELNRRRLQDLFGRYVPPQVIDELLKKPDAVPLGGRRQEVTVLFSDIRGFTSYSEGLPPEEVVKRLNEYFAVMCEVIFRHGGTLDKYLGDGIMALFGAPLPAADHARRALLAAVEMLERLGELNRAWEKRGEGTFQIGIGINSGPAVVGNIGSPRRLEYTAIGEAVNLASRLEGLNKEFGTSIILSEATAACLGEPPAGLSLEELGAVPVRGMARPVRIFTVRPCGPGAAARGNHAEAGG